jgi:hypothetical protein
MAFPTYVFLYLSFLFLPLSADNVPTITSTPTILMGTAFIPGSHRKSIQGSIITALDGTLTYRVSCPTGTTPGNLWCQKEDLYPALLIHAPGSIFAGSFTP